MFYISSSIRRHMGYNDYYVLLSDYFKTDKSNPSLKGLYLYLKGEDKSKVVAITLVKVLGFLQVKSLLQKIEQCSLSVLMQAYQHKLHCLIQDQFVTVGSCRKNLASNEELKLSHPTLKQYSWRFNSHLLDAHRISDKIEQDLQVTLLLSPMPRPLAKILRLDQANCLAAQLEQHRSNYARVIRMLYACLDADQPSLSALSPDYSPKSFQNEEFLLKHAACAQPSLTSWVEEIYLWGKQTKQENRVCKIFKDLKLTHFVIDQIAQNYFQHKVDCLTIRGKQVAQSKTFLDYMVNKSLYALSTLCPLPDEVIENLETVFRRDEEKRCEMIFFISLLHSLFVSQHQEPKPSLKSLVDCAFPLEEKDLVSAFKRAYQLTQVLFSDEKNLLRVANAILCVFILNVSEDLSISELKKGQLFEALHHQLQFNQENVLSLLTALLHHSSSLEQKTVSYVLTSDDSFADPQHLLISFIGEILLQPYLPRVCLDTLLQESMKYAKRVQEEVLVCLYRWLLLDTPSFALMECFAPFFDLSLSSLKSAALLEGDPLEKKLEILEEFPFLMQHPALFDLLHAVAYLLHFNASLQLNSDQLHFLLRQIQRSSLADRQLCRLTFDQLMPFKKGPQELSSPIAQLRLDLLKTAYKNKQAKVDLPFQECIQQLLENWPYSYRVLVDYHITFTKQLESFFEEPIPLAAILFLLGYCPLIPFSSSPLSTSSFQEAKGIGDVILSIQALRDRLDLRQEKGLFIRPSLIYLINEWMMQFLNSDIRLTSLDYVFDRLSLGYLTAAEPLMMGSIMANVQSHLLPSFSFFREIICDQATELFSTQGSNCQKLVQNFIYFPSSSQGSIYTGTWKEICYMCRWTIEKANMQDFPSLEMIIWQSIEELESRRVYATLEIPKEKLSRDLWKLLNQMLETLGEEITQVELEDKLQHLSTLEEEFYFCMELYGDQLKGNLHEDYFDFTQEKGLLTLEIFKFVKSLKIQMRMMRTSLLKPEEGCDIGASHSCLAAQGHVYRKSHGLSLLPHAMPDNPYYQLGNDEFQNEFACLVEILQQVHAQQEQREEDNLFHTQEKLEPTFTILTEEGTWKVLVYFDALTDAMATEGLAHPKFRNQLTLKLDAPHPITYAFQLNTLIGNPHLEQFLRWQLLMLKSFYYAQLLSNHELEIA